MYRRCIFCSADLRTNEAVEAFPVGRTLAFDAAKGRLWAVCPRCARWNLAPLEERWEAIEAAEKLFAASRLRAQSENVGLAKTADGTKLIRVGSALPGELAAWRYGERLVGRRRRYVAATAAAGALGVVLLGLQVAGVAAGSIALYQFGQMAWLSRELRRPVHVLAPGAGDAVGLTVRRRDLTGGVLEAGEDGAPRLKLRVHSARAGRPVPVEIGGTEAGAALARAMVALNARGAGRDTLAHSLGALARAPTPDDFVRRLAAEGRALRIDESGALLRRRRAAGAPAMPEHEALALEMALHEESERRALEGELALLESAWREAEEIAAIADRLATAALEPAPKDAD